MKIAIVEDEKLTAKDLARTIAMIDADIEIVGTLYTVAEAKIFFRKQPALDLIFSDIELGDGLSFEVFEQLNIKIPIVFCTAYEEYMLKAFQNFGIDYIVKPFQKLHVEKALLKFKDLQSRFEYKHHDFSDLSQVIKGDQTNWPKSILVYQADKVIPIRVDDIRLFYIKKEVVYAFVSQNETYMINDTLDVLEKRFNSFFRTNRQFLINRKAVKDASQYFNRKLLVNLCFAFPETIIISRLKVNAFLAWLTEAPNQ